MYEASSGISPAKIIPHAICDKYRSLAEWFEKIKADIATSLETCFSEYKQVRNFIISYREKIVNLSTKYSNDSLKEWKEAIKKDTFKVKSTNNSTVFKKNDAIELIQRLQNEIAALS